MKQTRGSESSLIIRVLKINKIHVKIIHIFTKQIKNSSKSFKGDVNVNIFNMRSDDTIMYEKIWIEELAKLEINLLLIVTNFFRELGLRILPRLRCSKSTSITEWPTFICFLHIIIYLYLAFLDVNIEEDIGLQEKSGFLDFFGFLVLWCFEDMANQLWADGN